MAATVSASAAAELATVGAPARNQSQPAGLEAQFKQKCLEIETLFSKNKLSSASNSDKLFLYSRYKQATVGDQIEATSKLVNLRARAMWQAWEEVKGRSKEEMMTEYNAKADELIKSCKKQQSGVSVRSAVKSLVAQVNRKSQQPAEEDLRDKTINDGLRRMGIPFETSEDITVRFDRIRVFMEDNDLLSYYLPFQANNRRTSRLNNCELIQFSSYSYLNLMTDPRLVEAADEAVKTYGIGSHGTRSLAGTTHMHISLEETLARFLGKEMALTFSTAYLANIATIGAMCRKTDFILLDHKAHRSLQDGCQLSRATIVKFRHNSLEHCIELMKDIKKQQEVRRKKKKTIGRVFLVSDTVFSMDGDVFPLVSFKRFCQENNIVLILDEAHGLGVIGPTGRGIEEHFNMPGAVDILTGTLGKSIPGIGGFCAGSRKDIRYLQMYGNPCVFSSPLPPYYCAVAKKTIEIMESEHQHVQKLQANARYLIKRLKEEGYDIGDTETAVVPVIIGDVEKITLLYRELRNRGYWVAVIIPPAVAIGSTRLRIVPNAGFDKEDLDRFIDTLRNAMAALS